MQELLEMDLEIVHRHSGHYAVGGCQLALTTIGPVWDVIGYPRRRADGRRT